MIYEILSVIDTDNVVLTTDVCIVEIKTRDGKWRSEVLRVDSSADTILMDKNDCGLLGYTFNECITTTAVVVLKSHLMLGWRSVESPSYQDLL